MCERSGSFVGVANDPVWEANACGWWGHRFVLVFMFSFVFIIVAGPWALLLCMLLALSTLLVLSVVVIMGVVVGVAVVVVVIVVVVVVGVGIGSGGGGGGRINGDGCDVSRMINNICYTNKQLEFRCLPFLCIPQNIPVSILECPNSAGMIRHRNDENSRSSCQSSFLWNPLDSAGMTGFLQELGGHCKDLD